MLTNNTITFGKYKGNNLTRVLRDRDYCKWLLKQEWFMENYEYLYNRIENYKPKKYFFKNIDDTDNFINNYKFFNLVSIAELDLDLSECDITCYSYYLKMVENLRDRILLRMENDEENVFNIKAPINWLKTFEKKYLISREDFKDFLQAYELPNIPYIVEDIKKEGGIEYKGAQSFIIAKKRSKSQEEWWEIILREKYGEKINIQFKFDQCVFDMILIDTKTIFECKLGLKDFNDTQYTKYKKALREYRIIYLVDFDCIVLVEEKKIYCLDCEKYVKYLITLTKKTKLSDFEKILKNFSVEKINSIKEII
jgi:hypothetical protein